MKTKYKPSDRVIIGYGMCATGGTIHEAALPDEDGDWLVSRDGSHGVVVRYENEMQLVIAGHG